MAPSIHILNPEDPYGPMAPVVLAIALSGLIWIYRDCRDIILLPLIYASLILVGITVEPLSNEHHLDQPAKQVNSTAAKH